MERKLERNEVRRMPKGKPNTQTVASDKYQKKIGLIAKSFKIKKSLADDFKKACEERGEGQAATISRLMQDYIDGKK